MQDNIKQPRSHSTAPDKGFKVIVLGDSGIGKSTIISRMLRQDMMQNVPNQVSSA